MTASPLWTPSPDRVAAAQMTAFARHVADKHGLDLPDYEALYRWSIADKEAFWTELWDYCGVIAETRGDRVLVDADKMPGRALLSRCPAELRREPAAAPGRHPGPPVLGRGQGQARPDLPGALRPGQPPRPGAAGTRRQAGRPGRRAAAQYAGGRCGDAGGDVGRCGVVVGVAGFRRPGRARPLRPDRAGRPVLLRRLFLQRQAIPDRRQGARDHGADPQPEGDRGRAADRPAGDPGRRRHAARRLRCPLHGHRHRLRAAAVRPSPLYHVLQRHDRRAEVHRPPGRRRPAAAPQGASPAQRRPARRPRLLLHHARLDDVELAGLWPRQRGDAAAL